MTNNTLRKINLIFEAGLKGIIQADWPAGDFAMIAKTALRDAYNVELEQAKFPESALYSRCMTCGSALWNETTK